MTGLFVISARLVGYVGAAAAICYVEGFLTVTLNLSKYHVYPVDLLHARYPIVGLPGGVLIGAAILTVSWLCERPEPRSARSDYVPALMHIVFVALSVIIAGLVGVGAARLAFGIKGSLTPGGSGAIMLVIAALTVFLCFALQQALAQRMNLATALTRSATIGVTIFIAIAAVIAHMAVVSPQLPQRWGGMQPRGVRLWTAGLPWQASLMGDEVGAPSVEPGEHVMQRTRSLNLLFRGRTAWIVAVPEWTGEERPRGRPHAVVIPAHAVRAVEIE
ncbi:MAG: hypothetical protein PVH68_05075 [Armatimonadota bacterium]|jgi:hypothetical protein